MDDDGRRELLEGAEKPPRTGYASAREPRRGRSATPLETERERLRQLRGYYGHLKRADMRTRTDLGEIHLGETKRACLAPLLRETERDMENAEQRICGMVKEAVAARRNGGARRFPRAEARAGETPSGENTGPGGRR